MIKKQREWLQSSIARPVVSGYSVRRLVDARFAEACGITGTWEDDTSYRMSEISRADLFDMLRVVNPENALSMICGKGITTRESATEFLESNGFQSLIASNDSAVEEALSRRIDLSLLIDMVNDRKLCHWRYNMECSFADLAALQSTSLRDSDIDCALADGTVSWSFVKSVGVTNIRRFGEEILPLEGVFSPAEIKSLVSRAEGDVNIPADTHSSKTSKYERLILLIHVAKGIGVQETVSLQSPKIFTTLESALKQVPDADSCRFMDDFVQRYSSIGHWPSRISDRYRLCQSVYAFHTVGFSAEDAIIAMEQGIDAVRAAAIRDQLVPKAVSTGWL